MWAQTNNRKPWQLWHAGQTRFEHTRILKIFVAVWDCEWARGNRLTCFCIQIWDRNTDRLFTLQLSLVSLVQLHSLKWEALSLGIHLPCWQEESDWKAASTLIPQTVYVVQEASTVGSDWKADYYFHPPPKSLKLCNSRHSPWTWDATASFKIREFSLLCIHTKYLVEEM